MKILILQRFDLSSVSCARRVICQAQELARRGHEVILADFVHTQRQSELPSVAKGQLKDVEIIQIPRRIIDLPSNITKLKSISPKPDIVHLWKSYPDASIPAIQLARHWGVPLHYDYDDWETGIATELARSSWAGYIANRWDRLLPSLADTVTTASKHLYDHALQWGADPNRIWDAPVGADLEQFCPRETDDEIVQQFSLSFPTLVYHGQLEVASYAEQAVEALSHLVGDFPNAVLLILGGGRKLDSIKQHARDLSVEEKIIFTDYIPGDEVPRYLSCADLALAPFESNDVTKAKSPLKIAEYLAMGIPVVASDIGEAPVMIGEAGRCVPCGDAKAMAQQARVILQDEPMRTAMQSAARERAVSIYNWKSHTDQLEKAYQTALT
ncbi:MAG: glycosyltransferase family 4 protein [Candidatus Hinthialibacter antarcticus]|nr:glycosyltransferase family 4 protein [Candidatus Hinthialibacter antarcticus]